MSSVNNVATERGVYTEEALRHRFSRVATMARRVAMVPENGASLLRCGLSLALWTLACDMQYPLYPNVIVRVLYNMVYICNIGNYNVFC